MVPNYKPTIDMTEKLKNIYIDHQQNLHADILASLAASLALTKRVLVYSHDLYYCKFTLEDNKTPKGDLQPKRFLRF